MTNYEYFKDEIIYLITHRLTLAVRDGEPVKCNTLDCGDCEFWNGCGKECYPNRKAWLNAECIEKPKLTKKKRQFCELVETGWIVRSNISDIEECNLFCFKNEPVKELDEGIWLGTCAICIDVRFPGCNFDFIKWDPEDRYQKPWSVEDLLKLEYEHDENSSNTKNERSEDSLGASGEQ